MYTRINRVWRVREREREKEGEEGRKRNVFGRGEKKFHRNGGSHCSLADGGARTWPGNGTWLVALSYLQQSSQQTPSSMLQRLASYLNGIALFLRRLFLLSLDREGEERGREKQTYKTLDEFLIVVVQFLIAFVSSRYIEKRLASESLPYFSTRIEFHWSIDTECEDRSSVITISQQRFN